MSFRIEPSRPLAQEVRRLALRQNEAALARLDLARGDHASGLHETRKSIKKLRALLRLVRAADEDFYKSENARYRDISGALAPLREASALVETLDRLVAAHPKKEFLPPVREWLAGRRERIAGDTAALDKAIDAAVAGCEAGHAVLAGRQWENVDASVLAAGAGAAIARWRKALRRAESRGEEEDFHGLRKAAKAHLAHLGLLARMWPAAAPKYRKRLDALAERLGELNDVFVLRRAFRSGALVLPEGIGTGPLLRLLDKKVVRIEAACVKQARKLYESRPAVPGFAPAAASS